MNIRSDLAGNALLFALPAQEKNKILPHIKLLEVTHGTVLFQSRDVIENVYFPIDCILSIFNELTDGACAEVGLVGNEGMASVSAFLGDSRTFGTTIVQSSGRVYCMAARHCKEAFTLHQTFAKLLLKYTQALMIQMAQTAVCNRHHSIRQQLCRWLLLSLDRLPNNRLLITQSLIADWLGVRREGVSEAASYLQKQGAIKYQRGHISIIDRHQLESASCECYQIVKSETLRLLPYLSDKSAERSIQLCK